MRTSVPSMIGLKGVSILLGLVSSILIARALGPADKGAYNLAIVVSSILSIAINFGFKEGSFFYTARGEMTVGQGYVGTLLLTALAACVIGPLGVAAVSGQGTLAEQGVLVVTLVILTPLAVHSNAVQSLLLGTNRAVVLYLLPVVVQAFTIAAAVVTVIVLDLGTKGMVWGSAGALAASQLIALAVLRHRQGRLFAPLPFALLRRACRFGSLLWVSSLLGVLLQRIDQVVVAQVRGSAALGQYALAVVIGELLYSIDIPLTTAMRFRVTSGTAQEAADLVGRVARLLVIVIVAACGLMALAAPWLVPLLYSDAYQPAVPALLAYLPAAAFLSISRVIGEDIGYQHKRTDLVLLNNGVCLAVNLVLLWVLVPRMGIVGAALASVGAYLLLMIMNTWFHSRLAGVSPLTVLIPRAEDFRTLATLTGGYLRRTKGSGSPGGVGSEPG